MLIFLIMILCFSFVRVEGLEDTSNEGLSDKILVEKNDDGYVTTSLADYYNLKEVVYEGKCVVSVVLKYDPFGIETYNNIRGDYNYTLDDYRVESQKYHTKKNKEYAKLLNVTSEKVFISEYTPFIFYYFDNITAEYLENITNDIATNNYVNQIYVSEDNYYETETEETNMISPMAILPPPEDPDYRTLTYDNFPVGTDYTGQGVKVGILDSGGFDTTHSNFSDIYSTVVYDTEFFNNIFVDPMLIASTLGGKYGTANKASIYFVDVDSDGIGFPLIEKLINAGVDIVNMSIVLRGCDYNDEIDLKLEGYFDYLYVSTHTIMVAAVGDFLDIEGSGGIVCQPASSANVISVGSVDEYGNPSHFSSYKKKNSVVSNPNIVAVGENRKVGGYWKYDTTSISTAAVTGAIALLKEKHSNLTMIAALSILSATANRSVINTSTENIPLWIYDEVNDKMILSGNYLTAYNKINLGSGLFERAGAGQLDITAALNYNRGFYDYPITLPPIGTTKSLDLIYLNTGWTLTASLAWEGDVELRQPYWWMDPYHLSLKLRDLDLLLYTYETNQLKAYTYERDTNLEMFTYTATSPGWYTLKFISYTNPNNASKANICYAYTIKM